MSRVFDRGNTELNNYLFENLSLKENDHILEIGSGTGKLACKITHQLTTGLIEGVDFSKSMFNISKRNNKQSISDGKVKFHFGEFEKRPFSPDSFDKVFSVNTVYFWQNPDVTIKKIARVLKQNGKLVVGYHEKREMEKKPLNRDVFKFYSVSEFEEFLASNGDLSDIKTNSKKGKGKICYCTEAIKK